MWKIIITSALFFVSLSSLLGQRSFITTWQSDAVGDQITIPTYPSLGYNYSISWKLAGDEGNEGTDSNITGNHIIRFENEGTYRVYITGDFPRIYFDDKGDKSKILSVEQWGDIAWTSMENAFSGCENLVVNASDAPDLLNVTDMSYMFWGAINLIIEDLNDWNVSNVTNMNSTFAGTKKFNGDVSEWNVSNVTHMGSLFSGASIFNGDISNWNVSKVRNMSYMFTGAFGFQGNVSEWVVSDVTDMSYMFFGTAFNGDIKDWDVSNVTNMSSMFSFANSFNGDISSWEVSNVTNMSFMFESATSFNQHLNWNTGRVADMNRMFSGATSFDQFLRDWDMTSVTNVSRMLDNTGMSLSNYDKTLQGWALQTVNRDLNLGAEGLQYCVGTEAREQLISVKNWTFSGDEKVSSCIQSITFDELQSKTFGDDPFQLNATVDSEASISYLSSNENIATISGNMVTIAGAGETTITARVEGDENHLAASAEQTLIINKANQIITFDELPSKTFGDDPFQLNATVDSEASINYLSSNENIATISGNMVTIAGAGETTITAHQDGDDNYNDASKQRKLIVAKLGQTITFDPIPMQTYGNEAFVLTGTTSSGLQIIYEVQDESLAEISGNTMTFLHAGTTIVTANQEGNSNYKPALEVVTQLTIEKAPLTIKADDLTINEGEVLPTSYTLTYSGFVNDEEEGVLDELPEVSVLNVGPKPMSGIYEIVVKCSSDNNYSILAENGTLTVNEVLGILDNTSFNIYPNPASDWVHIKANEGIFNVEIYDTGGRLQKTANALLIEISALNNGIYFMKLKDIEGNVKATLRLVKREE
ncbi:MAG: BspA family leucine-rich repeat surface protein [Ekhidna sp.]